MGRVEVVDGKGRDRVRVFNPDAGKGPLIVALLGLRLWSEHKPATDQSGEEPRS